jgi:hypothetical protein
VGDSSAPGFELERVLAEDGRVRVSGWWHGVRGRRFIRPSLTAVGARSRTRALAELEHKPWAATEDGRPWVAEFVWEQPLQDVEALELAVAPDLAVRIPLRGAPAPATIETAPPGGPAEGAVVPPEDRRVAGMARPRGAAPSRHRAQPRADVAGSEALRIAKLEQERDRALAARDEAIAEHDRLVERHEQVVAERDRLLEERGNALARAEEMVAERDRTVLENRRLTDERDQAVRERSEALVLRERAEAERGALARARDAMISERDQLIRARDQARAERNGLLAQHARHGPERERLTRERDRALALRDEMAAERDRHRAARDEAASERDRFARELERLQRDRDAVLADAPGPSRDAAALGVEPVRTTLDATSPQVNLTRRLLARGAVLVGVLAAVAIVLSR